jgi:L-fuculose-phosphate aldolase
LANHGLITLAADLPSAFKVAIEVETLAGMCLRALQVGEPVLLDEAEVAVVLEKFRTYGQQKE